LQKEIQAIGYLTSDGNVQQCIGMIIRRIQALYSSACSNGCNRAIEIQSLILVFAGPIVAGAAQGPVLVMARIREAN
jgi:hypothetical protein